MTECIHSDKWSEKGNQVLKVLNIYGSVKYYSFKTVTFPQVAKAVQHGVLI